MLLFLNPQTLMLGLYFWLIMEEMLQFLNPQTLMLGLYFWLIKEERKTLERKKNAMAEEKLEEVESCIPNDILIYGILTRIPTESLFRFRCVCKSWCNLLSNHFFIDLHSQINQSPPGFIIREGPKDQNAYNLFFFDINRNRKMLFTFEPMKSFDSKNSYINILSSLNGLLLISCEANQIERLITYHVYNPITRIAMKLPHVDLVIAMKLPHVDFVSPRRIFSLVYHIDGMIKKYKVVYCGYNEDNGYYCKIVNVGGDDEWRDVVIPVPHRLREYPPVFANGYLHWMLDSRDVENLDSNFGVEIESEGKILTMDFVKEVFRTIARPVSSSGVYSMLEMRGCLCFIDHVSNTELKVWVLKDLMKGEWVEEYNVDLMEGMTQDELPFKGFLEDCFPFGIVTNPKCMMLIKYTNNGGMDSHFYLYDLEEKKLGEEKLGIEQGWVNDYETEYQDQFPSLSHVNTLAYF